MPRSLDVSAPFVSKTQHTLPIHRGPELSFLPESEYFLSIKFCASYHRLLDHIRVRTLQGRVTAMRSAAASDRRNLRSDFRQVAAAAEQVST